MEILKQEDFTLTSSELAEAQGVATVTINSWAREGAFPYMRKDGNQTKMWYHKDCANYNGGTIKNNRSISKYKDPVFLLPGDTKPEPEVTPTISVELMEAIDRTDRNLREALSVIRDMERKLVRIETKVHAVAEGRDISTARFHEDSKPPTVGDMIRSNLGNS